MDSPIYLVITNLSAHEWHAVVDGTRRVIGRGSQADGPVPPRYSMVSRRHIEVWMDRRGAWLRDLDSRLGTKVNGVSLDANSDYQIHPGDRVWLGGLELVVLRSLEGHHVPPPADGNAKVDDLSETLGAQASGPLPPIPYQTLFATLTRAEREVTIWMSRGVTHPDDIARLTFRSTHTIRTQLNSIFRKLGVHSRDELLGWLHRANLPIDEADPGP